MNFFANHNPGAFLAASTATGMNTWILGILIVIYAALIAALGYRGYRKTTVRKDYLVAGRNTNPFVMAMSYGAAFISTSALVGFGGVAGQFGMGLLWLVAMNIGIGILVAFVWFGRRTRKIGKELNAATFPEFIGKRFHSSGLKLLVAGIIFFFIPLYSSVVLIGGARFLEEVMQINYYWALGIFAGVVAVYVIFGGLKGVMYVDALMGSVMIGGMLLLLIMCYVKLGGVISAHQTLTNMAVLVKQRLPEAYAAGHRGWTVMPEFNSVWWWTLVSSIILGVGIGALAQPQLAVRFMTVKSTKELNRAVLVGSVFILCTVGSAYTVGALSNIFFYTPDKGFAQGVQLLAIEAAGGNPDRIIPMFIREALPPVILYLFSLTMLSAAMSTMSSLFHVTGSSIGNDIFRTLSRSGKSSVTITRAGVVFGIIVSIIVAVILPPGMVARGTAIFFGVTAASFLPAYWASLYWKGATRTGIWSSIITGVIASLTGLLFLHQKEAAALGICRAIFGKDVLFSCHPIPMVDPFIYALPLSAIVLFVVSKCTEKLPRTLIERCFRQELPEENTSENK